MEGGNRSCSLHASGEGPVVTGGGLSREWLRPGTSLTLELGSRRAVSKEGVLVCTLNPSPMDAEAGRSLI